MVIDDHPSAPQASKTSRWEQQIRRVVQVDDLREVVLFAVEVGGGGRGVMVTR
jgi:hypothetical protein